MVSHAGNGLVRRREHHERLNRRSTRNENHIRAATRRKPDGRFISFVESRMLLRRRKDELQPKRVSRQMTNHTSHRRFRHIDRKSLESHRRRAGVHAENVGSKIGPMCARFARDPHVRCPGGSREADIGRVSPCIEVSQNPGSQFSGRIFHKTDGQQHAARAPVPRCQFRYGLGVVWLDNYDKLSGFDSYAKAAILAHKFKHNDGIADAEFSATYGVPEGALIEYENEDWPALINGVFVYLDELGKHFHELH
jgi:hypothetical protein